jgi:hypothetical protein
LESAQNQYRSTNAPPLMPNPFGGNPSVPVLQSIQSGYNR